MSRNNIKLVWGGRLSGAGGGGCYVATSSCRSKQASKT